MIADLVPLDHFYLCDRQSHDLDKFVLIRLHFAFGQVKRSKQIGHLSQKAGRRINRAERHDASGGTAGFFFQLADAAFLGVLRAVVHLAGRHFEQLGIERIAELPHKNNVAVLVNRQHADTANMLTKPRAARFLPFGSDTSSTRAVMILPLNLYSLESCFSVISIEKILL